MTTTSTTGSLPPGYFDDLYARDPDPWRFRTSEYEREKYATTVESLGRPRFRSALEVGCAIGELTAVLAVRCDALLGLDVAEAALVQARERNRGAPHVGFQRSRFPDAAPAGPFDLIVLSEVLYYFAADDMGRVAGAVEGALAPHGEVMLVHWLGETPDYPQSGDEASEAFITASSGFLATDFRLRRPLYRLDRLTRRAGVAG